MNKKLLVQKQGETDRVKNKKELIKRLSHIQHLGKQKNYVEIERLLQESYV